MIPKVNFQFFKSHILKLMFFILLINIFLKLTFDGLNSYKHLHINIHQIISIFLTCLFYWYFSSVLKNTLKINSYSISIMYFFSSYFLVDNFLVLFSKNINNTFTFNLITLLWLFIIFKNIENINIKIKLIFSFFIMKCFNFFYYELISEKLNYSDLNGDFMFQWFPTAKKIYELGYFFSISNNIIDNQGLLSSYIQALLNRINFTYSEFEFVQTNSFILCFLTILIFIDLNIDIQNKYYLIGVYLLFVLNNDWVFFLFFNSLMIEGVVTFFVTVCLINIKDNLQGKNFLNYYFFLCFGLLVLTKQFVSIISLLFILTLIFLYFKKNKIIFIALIPLIIDFTIKKLYNLNTSFITYDDNIEYLQIFKDLILFNNLNYKNISSIFNSLAVDKPLIMILFLFIFLNLLSIFKNKSYSISKNYLFYSCFINFFLVIVLYLTYWKNVETASAYRYIISFFNIYLISIVFNSEKNEYYILS